MRIQWGLLSCLAVGGLMIGGAVLGGGEPAAAGPANVQIASADPAAAVTERQELMKQIGGNMKAIKEFIDSGVGSAADVATRGEAIKAASAKIIQLFPAGSSLNDNVPKNAAKPDIWERMDEFKAAAARLGEEAGKLAEVAATGDTAMIDEQFGNLGKNGCGGCHTPFRLKTD